MRAQFYSVYGELCMQINSGGTTVIKKTWYDAIVQNLHEYSMAEKKMQDMKNSYKQYSLGTEVQNNELFRWVNIPSKTVKGKPAEVL
jgi:hypothetical protein